MSSEVEEAKKGLEGTGLSLATNLHGNLKSAVGDAHLKDILQNIKSSKTPVRVHQALNFSFFFFVLFF